MKKSHTDREYENQLRQLRSDLLLMAGRIDQMIADSTRALMERDPDLARRTIESDHKVNRSELEIDELCLIILAKRQPMASDLRFITLALKMVTDLERIGDLAVNICERAIDLAAHPRFESWDDIRGMADLVQWMVRESIDAFVAYDADRAARVIARDKEVDQLYSSAFRGFLAMMIEDSSTVERGLHLQSVAKWIERMGDHATNLAEQVIFMVKGKDVRHEGRLDERRR